MKDLYITQCIGILINFFQNSNVVSNAGALLTDLSNAFDCIDKNSLYFINSYLKGRKQTTKINSSYSAFAETLFGMPQGSILEQLLCNIYICDFLENSDIDIANYADGNTSYALSSDLGSVIFKLQKKHRKNF